MQVYRIESRLRADASDNFLPLIDGDGKPLQYTMPELLSFAADLTKAEWVESEWQAVPVTHHGKAEPQDLQRLFDGMTRRAESFTPPHRPSRREMAQVSFQLAAAGITMPASFFNLPTRA